GWAATAQAQGPAGDSLIQVERWQGNKRIVVEQPAPPPAPVFSPAPVPPREELGRLLPPLSSPPPSAPVRSEPAPPAVKPAPPQPAPKAEPPREAPIKQASITLSGDDQGAPQRSAPPVRPTTTPLIAPPPPPQLAPPSHTEKTEVHVVETPAPAREETS